MATHIPGVFAAGDVRSKNLWQIATAVGEGAIAAYSVEHYLDKIRGR
jgi:thioredoxin reductase (NADPH)